jgi:hypothetical protein
MRLTALATLLVSTLLAAAIPALAAPAPEEVRALREEIAALQVDRALNLTPTQARSLLPALQDASARWKAARAQDEGSNPALVAALRRARDELRASGSVSDAARQAVADARGPRPHLREQLQGLRTQLQAVLSPEQMKALGSTPLWIGPPADPEAHGAPAGGMRGLAAGKGPGGRGPGRRLLVARTLVSDPFLVLVQARAG